jgi:hypothetical protein
VPLIPFSPCSPGEPPESNCEWLALAGQEILAAALDGLLPFLPDAGGPCAGTFDTYLSMGPPNAEFYDALSVHLVRFGPTPASVRARERGGFCPPAQFPQQVAEWRVTLWEQCWPAARTENEKIVVPAPETLDVAAQWSYAHGIAMYESTVAAMVNSTWSMPSQIKLVTIGEMTPLGPQGLAVGWTFPAFTTVG